MKALQTLRQKARRPKYCLKALIVFAWLGLSNAMFEASISAIQAVLWLFDADFNPRLHDPATRLGVTLAIVWGIGIAVAATKIVSYWAAVVRSRKTAGT